MTASLGGTDIAIDDWQVDAASAGLQKCLSGPPGSAPITFNQRVADIVNSRKHVEAVVRAGELTIDSGTRQVSRAGAPVELTATEFDVLWCLVEAQGRVLAREEILTLVWGAGHHGTLRTIDNFLLQLRSKLERDSAEPEHLLTVRGVGYRFKI